MTELNLFPEVPLYYNTGGDYKEPQKNEGIHIFKMWYLLKLR